MDNRSANRFEMVGDGLTSVLTYERRPHALVLVHTEVSPALRGRHIADALAKTAFDAARAEGLRVVPLHFKESPDLPTKTRRRARDRVP